MKSSSSDFIFVGVSALIIAVFSSLLYFDFTKRLSVANAQEIGTITFKKRVAQRKYSGQVIWEEVEQQMTVYNNDTIRTSDISEAVVRLKDGTDISMDENSMILLSMDANAINIDFTQGSIFAKRGDILGVVKEITIQSQDTKVSIEKSDIQMSKSDKKDLDLTVTGGTAKVQIADKEQIIAKDEKITIDKGSKEGKIVKLQIKPISPDPNKFIVTTSKTVTVDFSWEPVGGNPDIYLDISEDKDFKGKHIAMRVKQTTASEQLEPGGYYWQLRAINSKDGSVELSGPRKLTIVRETPVQLLAPENNRVFNFTDQPPLVNFRWGTSDIANEYIIEIAKDSAFKTMVKAIETKLTGISVIDLEGGDYFWRVRSKIQIGTGTYSGSSEVSQFKVKKVQEASIPELISPQDSRIVSVEMINKKDFLFSWRSAAQFGSYRILISRDKAFQDLVINATANKNYYTLEKEIQPGSYFWKIQAVHEGDEAPPFSAERKFIVVTADRLKLIAPALKATMPLNDEKKEIPVSFTWEKASVEGTYKFEITMDKSFSMLLEQRVVGATSVTLPSLKVGTYFWRIRLLDENKNQIIASDVSEFTVSSDKKAAGAAADDVKGTAAADKEKDAQKEKEKIKSTALVVNSPVQKSAIYINGKLSGKGSARVAASPGDRISIVIKTPGYEEYYNEVRLSAGETKILNITLVDKKLMPRVRWKTNVQAPVLSKPLVEKDIIVVTTNIGQVVALNKFGNILWRQNLNSLSKSTPVVAGSSVYINTVDASVYSLELASGKIKWQQHVDGPLLFGAEPLTVKGKIFVATSLGKVHAFSEDGKELWKRDLMAGIFCSMDHREDLLYVGTDQSVLYALDAGDGDTDWDYTVDSRIISSSPKVFKDMVYVGTYGGTFYAIDAGRGRLKWKFDAKKSIFSNPAFHKDAVYFGTVDGSLFALNTDDGKLLWKFNTGERIMSEPELLNDELFITSGNSIYSLKMDSGKMSWMERFEGKINTAASAVDDDVCIGLENGDIVSLRSTIINVVK